MLPSTNKPLERLKLFSINTIQMRTFHITWLTFFTCFFGWFGLAPLMATVREDLGLTKPQIGNIIIASVSATIFARLIMGKLCDTWGPRKAYTALLIVGSIPVMCVGLAHSYTTFLLFRLAIGVIGASFVITQFHTSVMFASKIKGTVNAVAGGWGNLGGGISNIVMPLVFGAIVAAGYTKHEAWRYAMIFPGILLLIMAFVYWKFTKDTPSGNYDEISKEAKILATKTDYSILKDWRIWATAMAYGVCFGVELTFDNVAALHFHDKFGLNQQSAGFWAGMFGFMNIFARALGGIFADKIGNVSGMKGKGYFMGAMLFIEGIGIILFAAAGSFPLAIVSMFSFALFLKMANGAAYAITPFINTKNVGLISGIVGAGGNLGGMLFGFLFKSQSITYTEAFKYIGYIVIGVSIIVFITRYSKTETKEELQSEIPTETGLDMSIDTGSTGNIRTLPGLA